MENNNNNNNQKKKTKTKTNKKPKQNQKPWAFNPAKYIQEIRMFSLTIGRFWNLQKWVFPSQI